MMTPENNPATRSASLLRTLLICANVAFIVLHVVYFQTEHITSSLYSLSRDNGYSEFFQYTKFLWVIVLLVGIFLASIILWYVFLLSLRDGNIGWFLHERLQALIPKRSR